MEWVFKAIAASLPIVFAFAFLVPLIDQTLQSAMIPAPLGLSTFGVALVIGGGWGLIALIRGRWV